MGRVNQSCKTLLSSMAMLALGIVLVITWATLGLFGVAVVLATVLMLALEWVVSTAVPYTFWCVVATLRVLWDVFLFLFLWIVFMILGAAAGLALLGLGYLALGLFTGQAFAQEHNSADPKHWFEKQCCDLNDCRYISGVDADGKPWTEIIDKGNHYEWTSSKSGRVWNVPKSAKRQFCDEDGDCVVDDVIRPSRNGRYAGCEPEGAYGELPFCIYIPTLF